MGRRARVGRTEDGRVEKGDFLTGRPITGQDDTTLGSDRRGIYGLGDRNTRSQRRVKDGEG